MCALRLHHKKDVLPSYIVWTQLLLIFTLAPRLRQGTTKDVLTYIGVQDEDRVRVDEYFQYITHYSHPAGEGIAFLNELPKPLFEEVTGVRACARVCFCVSLFCVSFTLK